MKRVKRASAAIMLLLLAACGGGGGGGSAPPVVQAPPPPPVATPAEQLETALAGLDLASYYDVSFKALLARDPERVISLALTNEIPLATVSLTDVSSSYQLETFDMVRVVRGALDRYDRALLSDAEKISYDVYQWYLDEALASEPFINHQFLATYSLFGVQSDTQRFFTDIHPVASVVDAEEYIARLRRVGNKFLQLEQRIREAQQAGIVEPRLTMNAAISQLNEVLAFSSLGNPYFTAFQDKINRLSVTSTVRNDLRERARQAVANTVIPAQRSLRDLLQGLVAAAPTMIGVGQYPDGDAYYANQLRFHTTTDLTPAEVHQLGLDELIRIRAELDTRFGAQGYPLSESLEALIGRVEVDGGTIAAADALGVYEALISDAETRMAAAFSAFPVAEISVVGGDVGGFYIEPALDGSRPGAFYASTTTDQAFFTMPTLAYHEALPGHHYQIALAQEQDTPLFRKVVRATAYVEGWGLYAERLASDLDWYQADEWGDIGRLHFEALRAARLVIDTGIHEFGWTLDQGTTFGRDNVGTSLQSSQGAVARYSVTPGQATAYFIGMLKILELRERAEQALGAGFDLAEFHAVVVGNGGMPLQVLERVVDEYIAASM